MVGFRGVRYTRVLRRLLRRAEKMYSGKRRDMRMSDEFMDTDCMTGNQIWMLIE